MNNQDTTSIFIDRIFKLAKKVLLLEREVIVGHGDSIGFSSFDSKYDLQYLEINDCINRLIYHNKQEDDLYSMSIVQIKDENTLYKYTLIRDGKEVVYDLEGKYLVAIHHALISYSVMLQTIKSFVPWTEDDIDKTLEEQYVKLIKKERGNTNV